jgi:hypothetical protein
MCDVPQPHNWFRGFWHVSQTQLLPCFFWFSLLITTRVPHPWRCLQYFEVFYFLWLVAFHFFSVSVSHPFGCSPISFLDVFPCIFAFDSFSRSFIFYFELFRLKILCTSFFSPQFLIRTEDVFCLSSCRFRIKMKFSTLVCLSFLALCVVEVLSDCYLHAPPGSNDRLNEANRNRNNANR